MRKTKVCKFCGREFIPHKRAELWEKYCSDECLMNAWIRVTNWINGADKPYRRGGAKVLLSKKDTAAWRAERRERVKELYEGGMSIAGITQELDISVSMVVNDIKVTGAVKPDAFRRRRERVREMYEGGKVASDIADELGEPIGVIRADIKALRRAEGIKSPHDEVMAKRREQVKELRDQGLSISSIAMMLDVGRTTVERDLEALQAKPNLSG